MTEVEQQHEKEIVNQVSKALRGQGPNDFTFRLTTNKNVKLIHHPVFFKDGVYKTKNDITITINQDCYIEKLEVQIKLLDLNYNKWLDIPITHTQCSAGSNLTVSFNDNAVVTLG